MKPRDPRLPQPQYHPDRQASGEMDTSKGQLEEVEKKLGNLNLSEGNQNSTPQGGIQSTVLGTLPQGFGIEGLTP